LLLEVLPPPLSPASVVVIVVAVLALSFLADDGLPK